jgi:diguanylate cyclase (GGDEF)-like protein
MRRFIGRFGSAVSQGLNSQVRRDLLVLAGFLAAGYILATQLDVFAWLQALTKQYDNLPLGEAFGTFFVAALGLTLYGFTRFGVTVKQLGKRVEADEQAARVAMHDPLTGLPNRRHLKGVLNWHLSQPGDKRQLAVVALNLDGFRPLNDLHGRGAGDELLASVGQLLNMRAGINGFAARLDADEFVIVLQSKSENELMDWLSSTLTAIEAPFQLTTQEVVTGATAGVAMAPADGNDAETLLRRADLALRRAKEKTRGWFAFFKAGMDVRVQERAQFEHDLWLAVSNDEMEPWFQPIARLEDGAVAGYEVLARWPHATLGVIEPDQFIPAAEAADMIEELTLNVLRKACHQAAAWPGAPSLSFNVSPLMLRDDQLPLKLLKVLDETGFPAGRLEVEVTETALVADFEAAAAILASLKNQGVKIALDNFGTGHSTLGQLWALPFDKLKIDRSFVQAMLEHQEAGQMVRTIAGMAQNLELSVVAEGVTTEEQAKALAALGCETGQGELFGLAATAQDLKHPAAPETDLKRAPAVKPVVNETASNLEKVG